MADVDVSGAVETATVADVVSTAPAISTMSLDPSVNDGVTLADAPVVAWSMNPSVNDGITVEEAVTIGFTLKLYRGTNSVTVTVLNQDWKMVETYKQFSGKGIPLKGIILVPGSGGPDTFVIKDTADDGSYLYAGALSATTVIVYPGSFCKPMIDYSECTLTTGHKITFVW